MLKHPAIDLMDDRKSQNDAYCLGHPVSVKIVGIAHPVLQLQQVDGEQHQRPQHNEGRVDEKHRELIHQLATENGRTGHHEQNLRRYPKQVVGER